MTYVYVLLFLALMGYIIYFQAVKSKDLIKSPYNARQDANSKRITRGQIQDRNGNVLAETVTGADGKEVRQYPYGNLFAHVVGYSQQGKTGLESAENYNLLTSNEFFLTKLQNEFQNKKNPGDNIVTTLDARLQEAAWNALGPYRGAVVAIEPSTGKIVAMVSKPDYDPNQIEENWEYLNADPESALLNRATQGNYVPGSTFKVVTALEYMREHPDFESYSYTCPGFIEYEGTLIHCYNHQAHGVVDLQDSLAYSCNASFSNIGLMLEVPRFQKTAKELLFDSKLPGPLPGSRSSFTLTEQSDSADKMMTAMGQGQTQVSPYHMALITASIANGGVLMKPYLVDKITNHSGKVIEKQMPKEYRTLMTPEEAAKLKEYMTAVTSYGTASVFAGAGYTAAGKTGTAEYSNDQEKTHSWFIGMCDVDQPQLAISVIIEASDGSISGTQVAKQVFDAYYQ